MVLESDRRPRAPAPLATDVAASPGPAAASPDMAEPFFPAETDRMGPRAAAIALAGTFAFLVALIGAILRLRDLH